MQFSEQPWKHLKRLNHGMVISGNKVETKHWNVQVQTGSAVDRRIKVKAVVRL